MTERKQLEQIITTVLDKAKQKGATDCEVSLSQGAGFSTQVRLKQCETVEHYQDQSIDITVYFGQQKGEASGTDFNDSALDKLVDAACQIAKHTAPDPYAGLPDQQNLATEFFDCDLHHPWDLSIDQAITLSEQCEAMALSQDKRIINSDGTNLTTYSGMQALGNSRGFCHTYPSSKHSVYLSLIAQDQDQMQTDGCFVSTRDAKDLWSIERVAQEAVNKVIAKLNPKLIKTGQYPVVFAPEVAKGLIAHLVGAISGGRLYRDSSFLKDKLESQIFPSFITLADNPFVKKGLASCPYDAEGVKVQKRQLVDAGILKSYLLSSYSARKLGLAPTGHAGGVHNLLMQDQRLQYADQAALLKKMDTGLLVTDVMGQGVDLVTGNYSRGANGFWVEKGVIQHPVEEVTIAGNLTDIFKDMIAVANDIDTRGSTHVGSILIGQMVVAAA